MTTEEKLIKNKLGLLQLATYLKNVSEARRAMGYSRDTFYRVKRAYEDGGLEALKEKSRRVSNIRNRVSEDVETAVVKLALEEPAYGHAFGHFLKLLNSSLFDSGYIHPLSRYDGHFVPY